MIIDASALIAIIFGEPEARRFAEAIRSADRRRMSAANWLEASFVADGRKNPILSRDFDELVETSGIEIVAVTADHARIARAAYRDFGKKSGHPAKLNFGDTFAYALAAASGEPLLFKGNDFARAGVRSAID